MDRFPKYFRAFHPRDLAHGTLNYDIGALSKRQKYNLNLRKTVERNENEIYLKMHPEIKGLISILIRYVLRKQPTVDHHEIIGEFYNRPRQRILVDLLEYFLHTEKSFATENEFRSLTCLGTNIDKVPCRDE